MIIIKVDFKNKKVFAEQNDKIELSLYSEVKSKVEARFGELLPAHFGLAMSAPQSQPYMYGDIHNVVYKDKKQEKLGLFNRPMPVPCEVTIDSCRRVEGVLTLGVDCIKGIDEPLPWMDNKYGVTLQFLRSLLDNTRIVIYTRSDLVAHDDYIDELKRLNVKVCILVPQDCNEDDIRRLEPGAPSAKRRHDAVWKLVGCSIDAQILGHKIPKRYKLKNSA